MNTWFFNLLRRRKSSHQPQTCFVHFVIETGMTQKQFATRVADCFVGVERPEKQFGKGVKIFNTPNSNLVRLAWGEMPHAVGFIARYGGFVGGTRNDFGIALVQLPQATYEFLMQVYNAIEQTEFSTHVGTHRLDMTPIKSWFPTCS